MSGKKAGIKRVAAVILTLLFAFTIEGPACKSEAADIAIEIKSIYDVSQDLSGKTVILHSNDVHGAVGRYPYNDVS